MRLLLAAWLGTAAAWTAAPKLGSSRAAGAFSSSTRSSMLPSMLLEEAQGPEALLRLCATARSKCCLGGAPARRLYLPRARLTALGSSAHSQSPPRVLELAAPKVAHFTAFDHPGAADDG